MNNIEIFTILTTTGSTFAINVFCRKKLESFNICKREI